MKNIEFIEAITDIKDDYISDAAKYKTTGKMYRWMKWTAAIAACFVIILVYAFTKTNNDTTVIYASNFDKEQIFEYDNSAKLTVDKNISKLGDNKLIRVAVAIRNYQDEYSYLKSDSDNLTYKQLDEISEKNNNGEMSVEDYINYLWKNNLELDKKVRESEADFLKKIGAKDVVVQECDIIICTIRKKSIEKIKDGKCQYTVVMCTKNDEDVMDLNIESIYGKHTVKSNVYIPAYANTIEEYDKEVSYLEIRENEAKFVNESFDYYENKTVKYEVVFDRIERDDSCDIDNMTTDFATRMNEMDIIRLANTKKQVYKIYIKTEKNEVESDGLDDMKEDSQPGRSFWKLYITPDGMYLDMNGVRGIWKL